MMIKEIGSYVRMKYTVSLESGEIIKGDPAESLEYMDFVTGFEQVLPGLERRLLGLNEGDDVTLRIPPDEAFGPYDPSLVQERSFAEFPQGESLEVGKWVLATNVQHKIKSGYLVKEKSSSSITLDYNHPFAGKVLIYNALIVEVRGASQEELALIKPCDFEPGRKKDVVESFLGEEDPQEKA
jgi:FKBP-type peptidyl-prolyl cis-trans isomerase SlyD